MTETRRDLLMLPLLAALPGLLGTRANASPIDRSQTIYTLPGDIAWHPNPGYPPDSVDMAPLFGSLNEPGLYYTLVRWHPGYMSAPHFYATDRLCVVVSGIWWINSGADFDPGATVPVPAGTFIRRVAHTPHYDGVKADGAEPAVIAICGMGPVGYQLNDPSKPGWRRV